MSSVQPHAHLPAVLGPGRRQSLSTRPGSWLERQLVLPACAVRFVLLQVGLLAGVVFVRAKQLEAPAAASAPKADKPEDARLKSVSPK